jgi:type II secretion system protein G
MSAKSLIGKVRISYPTSPTPLHGFTLLEILVVVAILAVLVSIGAASYQRAQRNARDQQRIRDLNQVKTALEQYFEINQAYPTSTTGQIDCSGIKDWGEEWTCDGHTYMRALPEDPTGTPEYCYVNPSAAEFLLDGNMENSNNGNTSPPINNPDPDCTGDFNYLLQNEQ